MVSTDDTLLAEELVLASPVVRQLLRERYGIRDMSLVVADPWYYGERCLPPPLSQGWQRLVPWPWLLHAQHSTVQHCPPGWAA